MKIMTSRTHHQKISTKVLTDQEESKEIGARAGFSLECENLGFERTRDSGGFSTRLDGLESQHGVTISPRTTHDHEHQEQPRENQNLAHERQKTYEIESNSKPRRAQGGKGLLSHSISIQSIKNPWFKSCPREEREEEQRKEEPGHGRSSLQKRKAHAVLLPSSHF